MDIIQGKIDMIIRLLEQIVENTSMDMEIIDEQGRVVSPREIRINQQPSSSSGERDVQIQVRSQRDEEMWNGAQFDILRIGEHHRFIEQRNDRGIIHLHLQYWDDERNIWKTVWRN